VSFFGGLRGGDRAREWADGDAFISGADGAVDAAAEGGPADDVAFATSSFAGLVLAGISASTLGLLSASTCFLSASIFGLLSASTCFLSASTLGAGAADAGGEGVGTEDE